MKWSIFLATSLLFYSGLLASENQDEDFIGLNQQQEGILAGSSHEVSGKLSTAAASTKRNYFDEILLDETVSISLNCEKSLGNVEDSLKSFVMKSLDFTAEETLADLERPACRAFFDRNAHQLSKEQVNELMSTERGKNILLSGEALEFFADFSDFTLEDFSKFPSLKVGKIRDLSSISAEILLELVKQRGFINAGRLDRIPEHFGERILESEVWKLDHEIWQLFTLEGIAQIHSVANVEKFSKFLADRSRFEKLFFFIEGENVVSEEEAFSSSFDIEHGGTEDGNTVTIDNPVLSTNADSPNPSDPVTLRNRLRSSTITSDTSTRSTAMPSSTTSTSICKSIARNAPLLARWAVQSEELMLYMMEMSDIARGGQNHLTAIQKGVDHLIKTRIWLREQLKDRCSGATGISENESLHLGNLKVLLNSPLSWRLREALRLASNISFWNTLNPATPSQMTQNLKSRLNHFPQVVEFYRPMFRTAKSIAPNDHLLTHFFLVNEIADLDSIFGKSQDENDSVPFTNERLVLSIAIRRILLLLLSPTLESTNVIQDALNYVFSAQSPLLTTSDSSEILRWFRQAQDLQAIPVLDRLIRNFGHEFDVSREIRSVLSDRTVRMKLFTEAQSILVKLLVSLSNGLSEHLIDDAPRILELPYLDPANALLENAVLPLPVHPNRRPPSQEEIDAHAAEVERVKEHNAAINRSLQTSLRFLKTISISPADELSVNFAGFIQPNFRIHFLNSEGIDAGGLRRTWLSALLRIFGDSQRMLFPMHSDGGRTPAALLDPEIMSHLGALHGKSLQVGVKPDWFFTVRYTHTLLFAQQPPTEEELLELTEEMYPDIFGFFDLILQMTNEAAAVEYFNSSEFPTIEGLSGEAAGVDGNGIENVSGSENASVASTVASTNDNDSIATVEVNAVESVPLLDANDNDNQSIDSVIEDLEGELAAAAQGVIDLNQIPNSEANPATLVPRHSFSKMLVFDVRYLAQEAIYSGPRIKVETFAEIEAYRTDLLRLFSENLRQGRQAYWRSFSIFFDEEYRNILEADFLHTLIEPPRVSIEEILARVHFHRNCDEIFIIDDEAEAEAEDKEGENNDNNESAEPAESENVDGMESKTETRSKRPIESSPSSPSASSVSKKSKTPLPQITNITARLAMTRILQTSFTSPGNIRSLLSFATGCPQLPPAGLDALRISFHCYATGAKLSKSHTCTNTIDFYASVGYKATRDSFVESALSSSGFGFD